jgi:hypothetical protein
MTRRDATAARRADPNLDRLAAERWEGRLFDLEQDPIGFHNLWSAPDHVAIRLQLLERRYPWVAKHDLSTGVVRQEQDLLRALPRRARDARALPRNLPR